MEVWVEPALGAPRLLRAGITDQRPGDGYRWYYCFSLAFVAVLGWSPIIREMLGLKRRSCRQLEKAEDGARAQMVEEFIIASALLSVFQASDPDAAISEAVIDEAVEVTRAYHLPHDALQDWRLAFAQGFKAWKAIRAAGGGLVHVDRRRRELTVFAQPSEVISSKPRRAHQLRQHKLGGGQQFHLVETKSGVVEMFIPLAQGGFVNVGSKAEEWSHDRSERFRWHDVFHLANYALLGWSPVTEALLGADQSGAAHSNFRSQILEEAIVARAYAEIVAGRPPRNSALAASRLLFGYEDIKIPPAKILGAYDEARELCSALDRTGGGYLIVEPEGCRLSLKVS